MSGDGPLDGGRSSCEGGTGPPTAFRIGVSHPTTGVVLLRVRGEVDVYTSLSLMDSIIEAFSEHPVLITVDLSAVGSIDSAGLGTLEEGARLLEDGGVHFAVVSPSNSVK